MSIAAIFVLVITTLLVTFVFFVQGLSGYLIQSVQDKIDITAYFKQSTEEAQILTIKEELAKTTTHIKHIEYVSRQQALETFLATHEDSDVFSQALNEVGGNPFLASLNITTDGNPEDYEQVAQALSQEQFSSFIEKVDYSQKKDTIEKVFSITSKINAFGMGLALFLMLMVVMVVFNTTRLVIENSKEEISTMRIVGAPNWFVRSPFVLEGALFGLFSFGICFILTVIVAYFLTPSMGVLLPGFKLFSYFVSNVLIIVLIQLVCGVALGAISSYIVVRKYLEI
jgi:cell division transport system permease protein